MLGELKVAELTVFTVPEQLSCGIVTAKKPFSQHGRSVTFQGEGCVERSVFHFGQFQLRPVPLRPSSTEAKFDLGQKNKLRGGGPQV